MDRHTQHGRDRQDAIRWSINSRAHHEHAARVRQRYYRESHMRNEQDQRALTGTAAATIRGELRKAQAEAQDVTTPAGAAGAAIPQAQLLRRNFKEFCLAGRILNKQAQRVPFRWTSAQLEMARLMAIQQAAGRPVMLIVAKARKWGCSLQATWWLGWQMVRNPDVGVMVVVHKTSSLAEFRARYRQLFADLPSSLRIEVCVDNASRMQLSNGSYVDFFSAGTASTADNVGRASGYQWAHMTEIPFWASPETTMTAARNAVYLDGPGTGIILESTPNGAHGLFFEEYMRAKRGDSDFVPFFVAWHMVDEYVKTPTLEQLDLWNRWRECGDPALAKRAGWLDDPKKRIDRFALSCGQWNWWNFWLKNQCRGDLKTMNQEYGDDDVTCFLTSGRGAFDDSTLEIAHQMATASRPEWRMGLVRMNHIKHEYEFSDEYQIVSVREHPVPGAEYLAVMDPAMGGSNTADWTVLYIARRWPDRLEIVAKYKSRAQVHGVCEATEPLLKWFGNPLFAIECNRGEAHIHEFRTRGYPRLYRRQKFNIVEGDRLADAIGFYTDRRNRNMLFTALTKYIETTTLLGLDDDLYSEMRTMVTNEADGRKEAAKGCTDDNVVAAGILCFLDESLTLNDAPATPSPRQSELAAETKRRDVLLVEAIRQAPKRSLAAPTDAEEAAGYGQESAFY
jgi:hypothetical protein